MHWVLDDPTQLRSMVACPHTAPDSSGQHLLGRFSRSNVLAYWHDSARYARGRRIQSQLHGLDDRPSRYAYPIGTAMMPSYWAGYEGNAWGFANIFDLVPRAVLSDAAADRAVIIIDSLNEGFHDADLYGFLHQSCEQRSIPASAVVYVTSNLREESAYAAWADSNRVADRVQVIAACHWQYQYRLVAEHEPAMTWQQHRSAKHRASGSTKLYNCLNRLPRSHREYLLLRLVQSGLHTQGLISHGALSDQDWSSYGIDTSTVDQTRKLLPLVADRGLAAGAHTALAFHPTVHLDSWVSIVTETHAVDEADICYISEKTFKPINALQPFMVLGHATTLERLNSWGYETFESAFGVPYDHLNFFARVDAIISNLYTLRAIRDRWGWLEQLQPALLHNRRVLLAHDFFDSDAAGRILRLYQGE